MKAFGILFTNIIYEKGYPLLLRKYPEQKKRFFAPLTRACARCSQNDI